MKDSTTDISWSFERILGVGDPVSGANWIRRLFRSVEVTSPALAAMIAQELFALTTGGATSDADAGFFDSAAKFRIGNVQAWSWGRGPTVLLVHVWNGRGTRRLVQSVVDGGYRVVTFEFDWNADFGSQQNSLRDISDSIGAMSSALGEIHAVVAHSLGAAATTIALSDGLHTERAVYLAPSVADVHGLQIPSTLQARLLVVHDAEDPQSPWTVGRDLVYAWPSASFIRTSGLGHIQILQDSLVIQHVRQFIDARHDSSQHGESSS